MIEQFSRNSMTIVNKFSPYLEFISLSSKIMLIYEIVDEPNNVFSVFSYAIDEYSDSFFKHNQVFENYKNRKLHRHNFYEIIYILDGVFNQQIENQTFTYKAGDCCILNCNTAHRESFCGTYKAMFLLISKDLLDELLNEKFIYEPKYYKPEIFNMYNNEKNNVQFYNKQFINYTSIKNNQYKMESILDQILFQLSVNMPASMLIIKGLFIHFLLCLDNKNMLNNLMHKVLQQVQKLMLLLNQRKNILLEMPSLAH